MASVFWDVADERHFENDLDESQEPSLMAVAAQAAVVVERLFEKEDWESPSVYAGSAGAALALLRVVETGQAWAVGVDAAIVLARATDLARRAYAAFGELRKTRFTFLEGEPGALAVLAVCKARQGVAAGGELAMVLDLAQGAQHQLAAGECELLYGRCGAIQAIQFCRARAEALRIDSKKFGSDLVKALALQVIDSGLAEGSPSRLAYEWHETEYLGAAHGVAGIVRTLATLDDAELPAGARTLLHATLCDVAPLPSGNLPTTAAAAAATSGKPSHKVVDRCVHWCHGAPGFVEAYLAVGAVDAAERAGRVTWLRGLLSTKGPGLCHGTSGNGTCLLALWRATGEDIWRRRAALFAAYLAPLCDDLDGRFADRPLSLFEGAAGALAFFVEVLNSDPEASNQAAPYFS